MECQALRGRNSLDNSRKSPQVLSSPSLAYRAGKKKISIENENQPQLLGHPKPVAYFTLGEMGLCSENYPNGLCAGKGEASLASPEEDLERRYKRSSELLCLIR